MNVATAINRLSYRMFGPFVDPLTRNATNFSRNLRKANMKTTTGEYFSAAILIVLVLTPILTFFVAVFAYLLGKSYVLPAIMSFVLSPFFIFIFFYIYPNFIADSRRRNIDVRMPYAVPYMSAMAGAGVPPAVIFASLAKSELYGEIAQESKNIARDTLFFGRDIITVLNEYTNLTPSRRFSELLMGMVTTIRSGGDLKAYLSNEAENVMVEYRQMMRDFAENLGLFAESYITVPVFGTIFIVIVASVMNMIGGGSFRGLTMLDLIYLVVYIGIPGLSMFFLILIDGLVPEE
ncbi:MAG: type II secretion system F family protein [Candidatus Methanofastidiosia archaeon]